jgi:hypothetical protein
MKTSDKFLAAPEQDDLFLMSNLSTKSTGCHEVGHYRVLAGSMNSDDLALLQKWVELNRDAIIKHWDGQIESSADALAALKPLP